MEAPIKGTVTSLSSLFPVEEAQKASKRVEESITERQKQLDQLREFAADNNTLINLVQRLPDQLHHEIMVPFGKAAFFPGHLVHTNEFLVLLGEGHYAERTAKQTVEILNRRGKALEVQVEAVKALMQDLKAEASFFDATASEAAASWCSTIQPTPLITRPHSWVLFAFGLTLLSLGTLTSTVKPELTISSEAENVPSVKDEEYDRILSRLAELEKEEEEAENANQEELGEAGSDISLDDVILEEEMKIDAKLHLTCGLVHKLGKLKERGESRFQSTEKFPDNWHVQGSKSTSKDCIVPENCLPENLAYGKFNLTESAPREPQAKEDAPREPQAKEDVKAPVIAEAKADALPTKPGFDSSKAFTGSIIEHTSDVNSREQSVSHSSKPVSRFKMQRK
ncbi:putative DSC E3 ubiquitin ligase complex subunit 1-like isoform X1 [Capsicum annuum]|nr:putative DSC E3 ubiquitin ligase complex subunit 1-like isoform X1 [Capsicum annuum]KAF3673309.1 putative DSC E3 ubiquitin ligase complex subunit 1-like isoform X1 [Capsicum annuum]